MNFYICLLLISRIFAWNYESHFIIVRMAYDLLMERNPSIVEKVDSVLADYSDDIIVQNEENWPMVECTVYADQIKRAGGSYQSTWHYDDKPFLWDDVVEDDVTYTPTAKNISGAMPPLFKWLNGEDATDSWAYESIMSRVSTEKQG